MQSIILKFIPKIYFRHQIIENIEIFIYLSIPLYLIINMVFGITTSQVWLKKMIDKITNARDSNAFSIGIVIDLSKAFDTLNHNILFDKLEHYGVGGVTLQWICTTDHNMLFITA